MHEYKIYNIHYALDRNKALVMTLTRNTTSPQQQLLSQRRGQVMLRVPTSLKMLSQLPRRKLRKLLSRQQQLSLNPLLTRTNSQVDNKLKYSNIPYIGVLKEQEWRSVYESAPDCYWRRKRCAFVPLGVRELVPVETWEWNVAINVTLKTQNARIKNKI